MSNFESAYYRRTFQLHSQILFWLSVSITNFSELVCSDEMFIVNKLVKIKNALCIELFYVSHFNLVFFHVSEPVEINVL